MPLISGPPAAKPSAAIPYSTSTFLRPTRAATSTQIGPKIT
ncbi:hypothetical protein [Nocardia uniformis]|nr:hypothetical protein [Nocardia uniformis]